jgi:beta-galactosidase
MKRTNLDKEWDFVPQGSSFYSFMMPQNGETVNLPHDFTIGTEVSKDSPNGKSSGFYTGGIGSYTKYLDIPAEWEGRRILVEFDGAYMNAEVKLNGNLAALHPYGYTPFHADLTPFVKFGQRNRLLVVVNNSAPKTGRWYTGSGLYRHVDLLTAPRVHLAPWSIFAYTERIEEGAAYIAVEVTAENHTEADRVERISVSLTREGNDVPVARGETLLHIPAMGSRTGKLRLIVENPALWDIDDPRLYTVTVELENGNAGNADTDTALFGIRTISVDTKNGLMLNGKTIKIKGGCVHHDNGILGAASFYDSEFRKMKLHKDNGFNGIRCAHNPPSRDMLEACDRLGLLVLDEAFDMWQMSDNQNDYHLFFDAWWKKDMELFMKRDRNHPSVFMWSIGNEIHERNGLSRGYGLVAELAAFVRSLDPTRPLTSAIPIPFNGLDDDDMAAMMKSWQEMFAKGDVKSSGLQNLGTPYAQKIWGPKTEAFAAPLDVAGYNYIDYRYEEDGNTYPQRVICGTESYPKNIDIIWEKVKKLPYVIGDFTWASHDYIGEAGIGRTLYLTDEEMKKVNPIQGYPVNYPWRLAFCADFDICGFDRTQLHFRKIVWGSEETYLISQLPANMGKHEAPSGWAVPEAYPEWTFDGYEGKPTKVDVYSAAGEVELFLNGKSLGRKAAGKANRYKAQFDLCYEPGIVKAVSLSGGREVSFSEVHTAGKAAGIRITPEKTEIKADGQSLCFVIVEIVDAQGRRVPFDDRKAKAVVSGAGTLAAFGTGRPVTEENYTAGEFTSWLGRFLAVIRSGCEAGEAVLHIHIDGLADAEAVISIQKE